jgi:phage terminase large subunit-like protein
MEMLWPGLWSKCKINSVEMTIEHPTNGSVIALFGLDDAHRLERILGQEFITIWLNEASQLSFEAFSFAVTRLSQRLEGGIGKRKRLAREKMLIDCNPPSKKHWIYKLFIEKLRPSDGQPLDNPEHYAALKMVADDNAENIGENYQRNLLSTLSSKDRKRFVDGDFADDDENALFKSGWILRCPPIAPLSVDFARTVVAVDPPIKATGDEAGIIVAAIDDAEQYFVLEDASLSGSPNTWATAAVAAYHRHMADAIVVEINQGGDMAVQTIRNIDPTVVVKTIHATKGKVLRAEPVATLYEIKPHRVTHAGVFEKLEDQMTTFTPQWNRTRDGSPDRLDALVYALAWLSGGDRPATFTASRAGLWR